VCDDVAIHSRRAAASAGGSGGGTVVITKGGKTAVPTRILTAAWNLSSRVSASQGMASPRRGAKVLASAPGTWKTNISWTLVNKESTVAASTCPSRVVLTPIWMPALRASSSSLGIPVSE